MFTVCPKCALTLVVTAADLRVAQGYVRCGRCSNVFNALNALTDERLHETHSAHDASGKPRATPAAPGPGPAHDLPPTEAAPPPAPIDEGEIFEAEAEDPAHALEFDPTATSVEDVFVAPQPGDQESTGTFEAIVLEGGESEGAGAPDEEAAASPPPPADPDSELEQELQSLAQRIDAQNRTPAHSFSSGAQSNAASAAETLEELSAGVGGERLDDEDEEESRMPRWAWRAAVAALVLLLVIQAIHHYRHDLAVVPQLAGPLESLYGALGVSLEPRWDVNAYDVRQLGAMSDPDAADRLIVRASIKNAAPRPQPLPLLRVAVQDRFGNRIAASDVAPAAYVPRSTPPQARLASGQRIDIEMRFIDPGTEAVGFEIDACLAALGGGVNCANHAD